VIVVRDGSSIEDIVTASRVETSNKRGAAWWIYAPAGPPIDEPARECASDFAEAGRFEFAKSGEPLREARNSGGGRGPVRDFAGLMRGSA